MNCQWRFSTAGKDLELDFPRETAEGLAHREQVLEELHNRFFDSSVVRCSPEYHYHINDIFF